MAKSDNRDIIERTLEVLQPRTQARLTGEDARESLANLSGFFRILREWDARERERVSATPDQPGATPVIDQRATARCASRSANAGRSKRSARKALPDGLVPDSKGIVSPVVHAVKSDVPKEDDDHGSEQQDGPR